MSKQLQKLVEKAQRNSKGEAILNGRMSYGYGQVGQLREKYAIKIDDNIIKLRHWGTETLSIDMDKRKVLEWYGESNSDRDSMNFMLSEFGVDGRFRYRPSVDEFSYID